MAPNARDASSCSPSPKASPLKTYNAESWISEDNFYIGEERMLDNGDGTLTIDFNCDTPYSVAVGEGWNGSFRFGSRRTPTKSS